ncbi:helix-turn-helix domain-containing protein [Pseudopedobacter beijingensis]|uniref:Helix-turn-helix domain-containing protein n=1 Tax=Pseudopedobacter beijingensis TaxID=1207056 RepID=A0ABW4I8Y1_9SPHI
MNTINIILVSVCFLFLIFSLHLFFTNRDIRKLTRFLSIIIFTRVGQIIILLLANHHQLGLFPFLYIFFTPLYYIIPACLFLYIKFFVNDQKQLTTKEWLHFTPFIIAFIHFIPLSFDHQVNWEAVANLVSQSKNIFITEKTGVFPAIFMASFRIALMVSYLSMSWITLINSKLFKQKKWRANKIWLFFILTAATLFHAISISSLFIQYQFNSFPWFLTLHCIALTFVILYLLHKPNLLYGYLLVNVNIHKKQANSSFIRKDKKTEDFTGTPYNPISLDNEQYTVDQSLLEMTMSTKKPFLDPNFQILDLANLLGIPVHQCSQIINNHIGKNFRDWTNRYRVLYFIEMYPEKKNQLTIEALANESGFKSLTTFYTAFKKETGVMPKQYFSKE